MAIAKIILGAAALVGVALLVSKSPAKEPEQEYQVDVFKGKKKHDSPIFSSIEAANGYAADMEKIGYKTVVTPLGPAKIEKGGNIKGDFDYSIGGL